VIVCLVAVSALGWGKTVKNPKMIWWPKDDSDGFVPAFLEGGPKENILSLDKQGDINEVKFYYYNQANPNNPKLLAPWDDALFLASGFIKGAPLKMITHGFSSSSSSGSCQDLKDAYIASGRNLNIIVIDWGKFAAAPWYDTAAANTKPVGQWASRMIEYLYKTQNAIDLTTTHFMGHSLGSHVGGFCGAETQFQINEKIGRITALDPALPLFGQKEDDERIDPTDATYVDVVHTAGGHMLDGGLAFIEPRGHLDFYPNRGLPGQPGCGLDLAGTCSHGRCYSYFAESIGNPTGFRACKCPGWEEYEADCQCTQIEYMGEFAKHSSAHGSYYLVTNGKSPFAQG